ncbi:restriction endonuclease subunit S [Paenactinomyces guangxiensis]|uniref:Restriction endonuclease subunit S n=1 Tax=Paenactinomyces guangxiensis TaxID=1490290 RepID=A0A7W1WQ43_9BACL|nr:restriction endonuclease subunit S [Paenactinomyces guangxiensis]MBA4494005.1 restriction endonuclease subunit S [Paenactinomyces guangxiensis]MBH8591250.1 restriction endonuclease subunit S [Paenactinomyces guangxiensis]
MATKAKKKKPLEELLQEALVPEEEQPYEVPENWVWVRLGDIIELLYGKPLPRNKRSGNGYPVFGSNGIVGYHTDFLLEGPIIVIGRKGSHGEVNWFNESGWPIDTTYYVKTRKNIDFKFLFYLLKNLNLKKLNRSTAIPGLNREDAYNQVIPLPPLNEQKRIAEKVQRLLNKIDKAKQLIEEAKETFELRRAAILDKAFRGELGTNNPDEEKPSVETTLSKKEIPSTQLPNNWGWVQIKDLINPMQTRNPKSINGDKFYYVDIEAIDNEKQIISSTKELSINEAPSRARRKVDKGDVIISLVRPYLKNVAVITEQDERLIASTAFYVCRPKKLLKTKYLYNFLRSSYATRYLILHTKGDNSPSVRSTDFERMPIPLPPPNEQNRIAEKVERLLSKLDEEKRFVAKVEEKLNQLKQSILSKAFRGELDTNDPTEESAIELLKEILSS